MKRNTTLTSLVVFIILFSAVALSQMGMRKSFRGNGDNHRNLVSLVSSAQLQTTMASTSTFDCSADIRLDSIHESPSLELNVDLSTLTSCNPAHDMAIFSPQFIDWKGATSAQFRLLDFNQGRNYKLENEKSVPASGRGELRIGAMVDTVAIEVSFRYLEGNEVTLSRLPGDLLYVNGTIFFRLSDFGIMIPQEALLRLDDKMQFRFDIFSSTQMQ